MSGKKVSIIVPVYNCEKFLNRCVDSILKQSYTNLELILVDDGSTDRSNSICRDYEKSDSRVRVFCQENSGASVARNVGISNSQGDYIMFVDSDDYVEKLMVETLVNAAENENAGFVMCGMYIDTYDIEGNLVSSIKSRLRERIIENNRIIAKEILDLVESERINSPWCKLIRTSIIKNNNLKMPKHIILQEDLYFNIKVLEHTEKLSVIDRCLYHYNCRIKGTLTTRYFAGKHKMTNEVHDQLVKFYSARCNDKEILKRIQFIYIKNTYAAFINLFHPDCKLSKKEKLQYIGEIITSKKYDKSVSIANRSGIKHKILRLGLMTKNKTLIYYVSKLFYILKYKFGFRY